MKRPSLDYYESSIQIVFCAELGGESVECRCSTRFSPDYHEVLFWATIDGKTVGLDIDVSNSYIEKTDDLYGPYHWDPLIWTQFCADLIVEDLNKRENWQSAFIQDWEES